MRPTSNPMPSSFQTLRKFCGPTSNMDILFSVVTLAATAVFILFISFSFFLLRIYTGKSLRSSLHPPVKGTVFHQLFYFNRIYDELTSYAREHPTFRLLALSHSEFYTVDPRNVEHVLKTRFNQYSKGEYNCTIVRDLLGDGIFAVDGDRWRQQRKLASSEFSTRVLRDFSCAVFRRNAAKLAGIVSEHEMGKQTLDIQVSRTGNSVLSLRLPSFQV